MQAATYAIAVFGLTVVLGLCGQINLAQAAFFGIGAYAVGLGTVDLRISTSGSPSLVGMRGRAARRRVARADHAAPRRPLSRDGHDQLPADRHAGADQLDPGHARAGRHPRIARPALFRRRRAYLAFCVAVLALVGYLVWRLPRHQARPRDARGARQRARRRRHRHRRVPHQGHRLRALRLLGGIGGGLFAGGFAYISPDQFSFAESIVFLTMVLLGGVASPVGAAIGTGLLILLPEWLRFLKSVPGLILRSTASR